MLTFSAPAWLQEEQKAALKKAQEIGLPGIEDESWRYTQLKNFATLGFEKAPVPKTEPSVPEEVRRFVSGADYVLYFYNGVYVKKDSHSNMHEGALIVPLSRALMSAGRVQELVRSHLRREPSSQLKGLGWDNFAHFNDGAFLHIGEDGSGETKKVAVIHIHEGAQQPIATYPRNTFFFGSGASAEILEVHVCASPAVEMQVNNSSSWVVSEGARIEVGQIFHLGAETYCFSDTQVRLESQAVAKFFTLNWNGRLVRNEQSFVLEGEGAGAEIYGLSLLNSRSHVDCSSCVHHKASATTSRQLVKNVLMDESRAVFSGRLIIDPKAQKSDASQYNANLLLSERCEADSRPQLEISADDVKAAHGATSGQLNEEELFYLQSRGIPCAQAEKILSLGFQRQVIEKITSPMIRHGVNSLIQNGEANHG